MPHSTLFQRKNAFIKKHQQLSTGEKGLYWALAKCKKGYSKINEALQ
jgi:hypothetical protein